MSNKIIVAAAGSGKTTYLVREALKISKEKVLITTFTEANEMEIRKKFYQENGCIPDNVVIQTWFSLLIQHGVKPYQSVIYEGEIKGLLLVNAKSGLRYKTKKGLPIYYKETDVENYYFSKSKLIYSDKVSKFVIKANKITNGLVISRLEKIFHYIFIDEIQDMAGYDLEIIKLFFESDIHVIGVGDPRQVTYHTHDETKYKKYSEGNIIDFIQHECKKCSVEIDDISLNKTYRNTKEICNFANSIYADFKPCDCEGQMDTGHDGVFFVQTKDIEEYLKKYNPMQLRESRRTRVNEEYAVMNLGESKGQTFERVLIYPTSKMIEWIFDHTKELKPQSRSKFYVGVTRAKYSVAIVYDRKKVLPVLGIEYYV